MERGDNHLIETLKSVLVPIHKEGYPFIALFGGAALILGLIWEPLGWFGLVLTLWCAYFFRDPPRVTPTREGLVISPADGVVQKIQQCVPAPELELGSLPLTRISIFMNVFNVHVNRTPVPGKITALHYIPGKFLNASLDKASEDNERQLVTITTPQGKSIGVVQIAGLVARRILCFLHKGQEVGVGERFGLIRFGSRVDVYLPEGVNALVVEGQTSIAGETVLADFSSTEPGRTGNKA